VAVWTLGPEAVLRGDHNLVQRLLGVFVDKDVEAWSRGGRVSGPVRVESVVRKLTRATNQVMLQYANLCAESIIGRDEHYLHDLAVEIRDVQTAIPSLFPRGEGGKPKLEHAACVEAMYAGMNRAEVLLKKAGGVSVCLRGIYASPLMISPVCHGRTLNRLLSLKMSPNQNDPALSRTELVSDSWADCKHVVERV
jgi:hypothetical protein